jgi:glycosyltransferase involved in cell wall biosynthesis
LHKAKALIAISHYTKQTLIDALKISSERIHVTHLGVDLERFRPLDVTPAFYEQYGLSRDHRHLVYVGSEDPRKNLQTLIRAMALIRDELPDVRLVKVGKAHFDDEHQRLISLTDELGLRDRVIWLDYVGDDDLPMLYSAADLVMMPSLYEGFGFPVIEANACGTPVLAANATALPELVADKSALFDPHDSGSIAASIRDALARQHTAGKESQRWQRHAAQFTWRRTVQQTLAVYQHVGANSR